MPGQGCMRQLIFASDAGSTACQSCQRDTSRLCLTCHGARPWESPEPGLQGSKAGPCAEQATGLATPDGGVCCAAIASPRSCTLHV